VVTPVTDKSASKRLAEQLAAELAAELAEKQAAEAPAGAAAKKEAQKSSGLSRSQAGAGATLAAAGAVLSALLVPSAREAIFSRFVGEAAVLKSAGARYASLQKLVEAQQGDLRLLQASPGSCRMRRLRPAALSLACLCCVARARLLWRGWQHAWLAAGRAVLPSWLVALSCCLASPSAPTPLPHLSRPACLLPPRSPPLPTGPAVCGTDRVRPGAGQAEQRPRRTRIPGQPRAEQREGGQG
jgi:hypothetical protein